MISKDRLPSYGTLTFDLIGTTFKSDVEEVLLLNYLIASLSHEMLYFFFIIDLIVQFLSRRNDELFQTIAIGIEDIPDKDHSG